MGYFFYLQYTTINGTIIIQLFLGDDACQKDSRVEIRIKYFVFMYFETI